MTSGSLRPPGQTSRKVGRGLARRTHGSRDWWPGGKRGTLEIWSKCEGVEVHRDHQPLVCTVCRCIAIYTWSTISPSQGDRSYEKLSNILFYQLTSTLVSGLSVFLRALCNVNVHVHAKPPFYLVFVLFCCRETCQNEALRQQLQGRVCGCLSLLVLGLFCSQGNQRGEVGFLSPSSPWGGQALSPPAWAARPAWSPKRPWLLVWEGGDPSQRSLTDAIAGPGSREGGFGSLLGRT